MIIGILGLVAMFLLSVMRPAWALGLILALLPTYMIRFKILETPTTALELMVGVFLLAVLLTHWNRESAQRLKSLKEINFLAAGLILAAGLGTLVSPEPIRALGQLKAFFVEPALFFYAAVLALKRPSDTKLVLRCLFLSATVISLMGIVQYWTHLFLPVRFWGYGLEMKRITSLFEYPNALALYLAPLVVLFLALQAKGYELVRRHWATAGLVLMSIALVLTYSRGAWLGAAAGIFVLLIRQSGVSLKKWGTVAVIGLLVLSPLLVTRLKSTFHDGASSERLQLYQVAWDKISQSPFLGNGLYGFRQTLENSDYTGEILNYPHNIILNFWVETGLLGIISFAAILFFAMRKYKNRPTVLKFAAGLFLLAMFTHGMVDVPYFKNDLSMMFWFVLALIYQDE